MNSIDFSPLYRSTIGFDRLASMLDSALQHNAPSNTYPPYNIEAVGEHQYAITLAVAGFDESELDIQAENGVLTVRGRKEEKTEEERPNFLYQGIATRAFERKFNLADYVEVHGAELKNGLLTVRLEKVIPEAMKPRRVPIATSTEQVGPQLESAGNKAA